ncbi:MAG: uncharacterized protein JWL62_2597 [Hyphomicrobiales bacterium]|nr:uncharacterized protein [Hyphomicrobiales bacterium]
MSTHYHAVIWIDHSEARVFHFNASEVESLVLHPHNPTHHIHHKADEVGSRHAADDQKFLHAVAHSVADAQEILITGPAGTKTALVKHISKHDNALLDRIVGVESSDHPTDSQIVAHARHYFAGADLRTPQKS